MAEILKQPDTNPNPLPTIGAPDGGDNYVNETGDFVRKNQNLILSLGAGVIVGVALFLGYRLYTDAQNKEAQSEMFYAINYFEADSLKKAISGDGNHMGLQAVADDYSLTKSGKLAHFYLGAALLKQGKFEDAAGHLEDFSSNDILVQGRAYALLGDAHSELNHLDKAEDAYKKAASYKPNKFFTPTYLMKLAIVQEARKDYKGAADSYAKIINDYYESPEAAQARKYKARAEGLAGS